jgi:hypothetical protein
LAEANGCDDGDVEDLVVLARLHDIDLGWPRDWWARARSAKSLEKYGIGSATLCRLFRYRDVCTWWFNDAPAPPKRTWKRLARRVDLRLLCLFMVADRVDYPGGWRRCYPLTWFLAGLAHLGLLPEGLSLDGGVGTHTGEPVCRVATRGEPGSGAELGAIEGRLFGLPILLGRYDALDRNAFNKTPSHGGPAERRRLATEQAKKLFMDKVWAYAYRTDLAFFYAPFSTISRESLKSLRRYLVALYHLVGYLRAIEGTAAGSQERDEKLRQALRTARRKVGVLQPVHAPPMSPARACLEIGHLLDHPATPQVLKLALGRAVRCLSAEAATVPASLRRVIEMVRGLAAGADSSRRDDSL